MNEARRSRYNDQRYMNQLNHHNSRGPEILDYDDVLQYISSFDSPKNSIRRPPFFQQHQQQVFRDGMAK